MRAFSTLAPVGLLVLTFCGPAGAQATTDRFVMDRTEDGWVRMDGQTGEITLCRREGPGLVCETNRADASGMNDTDRIARLERRIEALESRLGDDATVKEALPSEEEFDQALGYMRRFFYAFRDMVRDLKEDEAAGDQL